MQYLVIIRILGLLLMVFSTTMLPPVVVDRIYQESSSLPFLEAFALLFSAGIILYLPLHKHKKDLQIALFVGHAIGRNV